MSPEQSGETYRWYSLSAGQHNGFFVDQSNRILYWPTANAPGYVLTPNQVDEVVSRQWWAGMLVVPVLYAERGAIEHFFREVPQFGIHEWIVANFSELPAFVAAAALSTVVFYGAWLRFIRDGLCRNYPTVDRMRPTPQRLKPSEYGRTQGKVYFLTIRILGSGLVVFGAFLGFHSSILSNRIFTAVGVAVWCFALWLLWKRERDGLTRSQLVFAKISNRQSMSGQIGGDL